MHEPWVAAARTQFAGGLDVLVSELEATLPGRLVDERGQWSAQPLRLERLHWLLVVVLSRQDFAENAEIVEEIGLVRDADVVDIAVLCVGMLLVSAVLSWLFSSYIVRPLKELQANMRVVQANLARGDEQKRELLLGPVSEDEHGTAGGNERFERTLTFSHETVVSALSMMRKHLLVINANFHTLTRFVPRQVDLLSPTRKNHAPCTVVHCSLVDSVQNVGDVRTWVGLTGYSGHEQKVTAWNTFLSAMVKAVEEEDGVVVDFSGGEALMFWHGSQSARRALNAVTHLMDTALKKLEEVPPKNLRCTFGVVTPEEDCAFGVRAGEFAECHSKFSVKQDAARLARDLDELNLAAQTEQTLKRTHSTEAQPQGSRSSIVVCSNTHARLAQADHAPNDENGEEAGPQDVTLAVEATLGVAVSRPRRFSIMHSGSVIRSVFQSSFFSRRAASSPESARTDML
eukprot:601430-Rhodomonas_salina.1